MPSCCIWNALLIIKWAAQESRDGQVCQTDMWETCGRHVGGHLTCSFLQVPEGQKKAVEGMSAWTVALGITKAPSTASGTLSPSPAAPLSASTTLKKCAGTATMRGGCLADNTWPFTRLAHQVSTLLNDIVTE